MLLSPIDRMHMPPKNLSDRRMTLDVGRGSIGNQQRKQKLENEGIFPLPTRDRVLSKAHHGDGPHRRSREHLAGAGGGREGGHRSFCRKAGKWVRNCDACCTLTSRYREPFPIMLPLVLEYVAYLTEMLQIG